MIVLSECTLLPQALLPLTIFEPRYQAMLTHALETDRLCCVGELIGLSDADDAAISPYSCAGLIRACVGPDGTSKLVLQGVSRIRFTGWHQRSPFRIATIEPVPTRIVEPTAAAALALQVMAAARRGIAATVSAREQFDRHFAELTDPELIVDVIGYNFLPSADLRRPLLRMETVEERLRFLLRALD
jgi:Lon protease-like protein